VAEAACVTEHGLGRVQEVLLRGLRSGELRFGLPVTPRLVRDSAEREPRLLDGVVFDVEAHRDRYEGERIRQAIADFQIGVVGGKAFGRQFDRRDDLVRPQIGVDLRRIARQAVEVGKQNAALAARAGREHARLEGGERDA
jgi:hypothetical protein